MKKIKLIKGIGYDCRYDEQRISFDDISEWEEVSNEDYNFIIENRYILEKSEDEKIMILCQDQEVNVPTFIKDIKAEIISQQEKRKKIEEKEKQKIRDRKAKEEARKIEKAKKLLAERGILK